MRRLLFALLLLAAPAAAEQRGTGFFINADGWIVTAEHVVAGCKAISISGPEIGRATARREKITTLDEWDMALLVTDAPPPEWLTVRGFFAFMPGERIYVAGYVSTGFLFVRGTVQENTLAPDLSLVQSSADVQRGQSGGPVFDQSGLVMGFARARYAREAIAKRTGALPPPAAFTLQGLPMQTVLGANKVRYAKADPGPARSEASIRRLAEQATVRIDCD